MTTLDKIIEFLHYHPGTGRRDLMSALSLEIKDSQMKNVLAEGVRNGDLYTEGKARATRYFIPRKAHVLRTSVNEHGNLQSCREEVCAVPVVAVDGRNKIPHTYHNEYLTIYHGYRLGYYLVLVQELKLEMLR